MREKVATGSAFASPLAAFQQAGQTASVCPHPHAGHAQPLRASGRAGGAAQRGSGGMESNKRAIPQLEPLQAFRGPGASQAGKVKVPGEARPSRTAPPCLQPHVSPATHTDVPPEPAAPAAQAPSPHAGRELPDPPQHQGLTPGSEKPQVCCISTGRAEEKRDGDGAQHPEPGGKQHPSCWGGAGHSPRTAPTLKSSLQWEKNATFGVLPSMPVPRAGEREEPRAPATAHCASGQLCSDLWPNPLPWPRSWAKAKG